MSSRNSAASSPSLHAGAIPAGRWWKRTCWRGSADSIGDATGPGDPAPGHRPGDAGSAHRPACSGGQTPPPGRLRRRQRCPVHVAPGGRRAPGPGAPLWARPPAGGRARLRDGAVPGSRVRIPRHMESHCRHGNDRGSIGGMRCEPDSLYKCASTRTPLSTCFAGTTTTSAPMRWNSRSILA
jgi:hypothetical protein